MEGRPSGFASSSSIDARRLSMNAWTFSSGLCSGWAERLDVGGEELSEIRELSEFSIARNII